MFERLYGVLYSLLAGGRLPVRSLFSKRMEPFFIFTERHIKGLLFDCRMCGQCILSSTGMSCPANCPKLMRNGPCGGVRSDGRCEVDPEMRCVWVEAWNGSDRMANRGAISDIQPALDFRLRDTSAWLRSINAPNPPVALAARRERVPVQTAPTKTNRLEEVLRFGRFAVTAELSPPDSADPRDAISRASVLAEIVDAINITDGSGANCHISSMSVAALLASEGLTPVMQITCRDRNRIAIQGDILGASALGITNLLCLTGDAIGSGDHPDAVAVCDLDSVSLLQAARKMRDEGLFLSGQALSTRPGLFLGAAVNPFSPPHWARAAHFAKKVAAGAQFVQTQFCFDVPMLESFMAQVRELGLDQQGCSILVGVGILPSARTARWMRSSVPGVHIPDHVIERLERAKDQRREGRQLCIELIQQLRDVRGVSGVHVMAYRNEELIADVVQASAIRSSDHVIRAAAVDARDMEILRDGVRRE